MSEDKDRVSDLMTTPEGSWPEREALFRKMFEAVMNELIRRDGVTVDEQVFKGMRQRIVLMAITDLAASLVVLANEADGEYGGGDWMEMTDNFAEEMSRRLVEDPPIRVQ
jgi:hypothetical protein